FEFAAALAGVAEQLLGRRLSEQRLLELARADRRRSHAADRHRDAAELAGGIRIDQGGGRGDGEVAMPAGEIHESGGPAVLARAETARRPRARSARWRASYRPLETARTARRVAPWDRRRSPSRRNRLQARRAPPPDRDGRVSRRWCRGCASAGARPAAAPRA